MAIEGLVACPTTSTARFRLDSVSEASLAFVSLSYGRELPLNSQVFVVLGSVRLV